MLSPEYFQYTWWHHQMETFSALLAICAGNSPVPGEFPTQRTVTRSCDVFFDLRLNKRLSKQSWGWWFETLSRPLWRQWTGSITWLRMAWPAHQQPWYGLCSATRFLSTTRSLKSSYAISVSRRYIGYDDFIKWKHCPRYSLFVRGIYRSPVNSPHKGQWRGALVFSLILAWTNGSANHRDAGDLRRHLGHYDDTVMSWKS